MNGSIEFFDAQFQRQVRAQEFVLNPFERFALPFLHGRVLNLGCGLGNLSIEAARCGCSVLALDASTTAIEHIRSEIVSEGLSIRAEWADLASYQIEEDFDVIVSIGLLMFLDESRAHQLLEDIKRHVTTGGTAIINVLIEGTTFMDMFDPDHYYLFAKTELEDCFADWDILETRYDSFDAPIGTAKSFATIAARKRAG